MRWLRGCGRIFPEEGRETTVCLAAEDKAVIAAAFLASLAGGPVLLLPYAFSGQALAGLQKTTGVTVAISDVARDFPPGTEVIRPKSSSSSPQLQQLYRRSAERTAPVVYGRFHRCAADLVKDRDQYFCRGPLSGQAFQRFGQGSYRCHHFSLSCLRTALFRHAAAGVRSGCPAGDSLLSRKKSFRPPRIARRRSSSVSRLITGFCGANRSWVPRCGWHSLPPVFLKLETTAEFCRNNAVGIIEVYGSTETGGIALRNRFRGEEQFTPYPTVDWKIDGQQLQVRSPYLSPGLTRDGDGFFTTGDRVEACGSSGFFLKGRADSITKVGGNRVDLEEISALLKQQPGVADCLVLALAEGGGRQHRIVALIEGDGVNIEALKKMLASRLEPYALPRTIKTVGRMPMKENGKYDRDEILRLFEQ